MTIRIPDWLQMRMRSKSRHHALLRHDLWTFVALLWLPVIATAAPLVSSLELLAAVPVALIVVAAFVSTLFGVTSLAYRIDRALSAAPDKPLPHLWVTCVANMLGSWSAGCLGFFLSQGQDWNIWLGLACVSAMSFSGAKAVEAVSDKLLAKAVPVISIEPKDAA